MTRENKSTFGYGWVLGGQVTSTHRPAAPHTEFRFHLSSITSHAAGHGLQELLCVQCLRSATPMHSIRSEDRLKAIFCAFRCPVKGEDRSPCCIRLDGTFWTRCTQGASDPFQPWKVREWAETEEERTCLRNLLLFFLSLCLSILPFRLPPMSPSLFFSILIHLFSFTFLFLFTLCFLSSPAQALVSLPAPPPLPLLATQMGKAQQCCPSCHFHKIPRFVVYT